MNARNKYGKILVNLLVAGAVILLLVFVLPKVLVFFMPFVIGWIIAMIANPLVRFLEKKIKLRRKHSSAIIIILVLAAVIGLIYLIVAALARQIMGLIEDAPALFAKLQEQVSVLGESLQGIYNRFPLETREMIDSAIAGLGSGITGLVNKIDIPGFSGAGDMVHGVVDVLLMTIIVILSSYFFIADRDIITARVRKVVPNSLYEKYVLVTSNFSRAVGGYFKAQFKIMLVIVLIMFIGFEILRVPYSFLLAIVIAFLDFLPVLGTGTVLWPWALMEVINGNYFRVVGLLVIYIICQLIKQLLQPKMVGDSIGMSPLVTLVFLFIGYRLGGVFGMIIGIPVGMVIVNFFRAGMFDGIIEDVRTIANDINEYRRRDNKS